MADRKIIVIGKIPPPFIGTSVWFESLRHSAINMDFQIYWFNVNIHKNLNSIGKKGVRKTWLNMRLYFSFSKVLKDFKPQLVLVPISQQTIGFLKDSVFIRLAKKRSRVLVMLHGSGLESWLNGSGKITNNYVGRTFKGTSGAIVLGNNLLHMFKRWFREEEIFVVPNGLNLDFSTTKREHGSRLIVRYLGNLQPSKGIRETLEAFRLLYQELKDLEMRVAGQWRDKETKDWCEKQVREHALPVIFEGPVYGHEKLKALTNSDLFVFTPNKPEGHPLVIIEAMAAGLPIISTDQGAIIESVLDGENGFIVPVNDPPAIAEKLKLLIEDKALREKMGRRSRELYEQNFTEEKMVERLASAINKTLDS